MNLKNYSYYLSHSGYRKFLENIYKNIPSFIIGVYLDRGVPSLEIVNASTNLSFFFF